MEGKYSIEFGDLIEERFRDRPMSELSAAKDAVAQLEQEPGWLLLMDLIGTLYDRKTTAVRLAFGKDPGEYALFMARAHGFLAGLEVLRDCTTTLPQKYDEIRRGVAGLVGVREEQ